MKTTVRRIVVLSLGLLLAMPAHAAAQPQSPADKSGQTAPADSSLPLVTSNTPVVWVITTDGQERKGRLVSFTPDRLIVQVDKTKTNQTIKTAEIARVDTTDALSNGIRNGAVSGAVAGGLFFAVLVGSCEGDCGGGEAVAAGIFGVGFYTLIGAGLGAFFDHLVDGRRAIYTRTAPTSGLSVGPILGSQRKGIALRWSW
jgi:hypothetical protein